MTLSPIISEGHFQYTNFMCLLKVYLFSSFVAIAPTLHDVDTRGDRKQPLLQDDRPKKWNCPSEALMMKDQRRGSMAQHVRYA
jgi:hypothetical protein